MAIPSCVGFLEVLNLLLFCFAFLRTVLEMQQAWAALNDHQRIPPICIVFSAQHTWWCACAQQFFHRSTSPLKACLNHQAWKGMASKLLKAQLRPLDIILALNLHWCFMCNVPQHKKIIAPCHILILILRATQAGCTLPRASSHSRWLYWKCTCSPNWVRSSSSQHIARWVET